MQSFKTIGRRESDANSRIQWNTDFTYIDPVNTTLKKDLSIDTTPVLTHLHSRETVTLITKTSVH